MDNYKTTIETTVVRTGLSSFMGPLACAWPDTSQDRDCHGTGSSSKCKQNNGAEWCRNVHSGWDPRLSLPWRLVRYKRDASRSLYLLVDWSICEEPATGAGKRCERCSRFRMRCSGCSSQLKNARTNQMFTTTRCLTSLQVKNALTNQLFQHNPLPYHEMRRGFILGLGAGQW